MYACTSRPSITQKKPLLAHFQMLYSVRSERLLMEEMDYNLRFRWFVGSNASRSLDATTFAKNRDRLETDGTSPSAAC
jgi:transposase